MASRRRNSRRNPPTTTLAPLPGISQETALANCKLRVSGHLKLAYVLRYHPTPRGGTCNSVQEAMRTGEIPMFLFDENGEEIIETVLERLTRLGVYAVLYHPGDMIPFRFASLWAQRIPVQEAKDDDDKSHIQFWRYNATPFRKYVKALGIPGLGVRTQRKKDNDLHSTHGFRLTASPEDYLGYTRKKAALLIEHGIRVGGELGPENIRPSDLRSDNGKRELAELIAVVTERLTLSSEEKAHFLPGK